MCMRVHACVLRCSVNGVDTRTSEHFAAQFKDVKAGDVFQLQVIGWKSDDPSFDEHRLGGGKISGAAGALLGGKLRRYVRHVEVSVGGHGVPLPHVQQLTRIALGVVRAEDAAFLEQMVKQSETKLKLKVSAVECCVGMRTCVCKRAYICAGRLAGWLAGICAPRLLARP